MAIINIVGVDPALRNFGLAAAHYDTTLQELKLVDISIVQTEAEKKLKVVRKSSDDLRSAREMLTGMSAFLKRHEANIVVGEVPSGTQSARGSFSNGVCCGVLASIPFMIEVSPSEVKLAAVGHKYASKEEMIEWAVAKYPDLPWLRQQRNGAKFKKGDLMADNEHMADAVAAIHAGVHTAQFNQAVAMSRLVG